MSMIRIILLVLLIWILWRLGQRWWYKNLAKSEQDNTTNQQSKLQKLGTMVRCDHCTLYVPENEAVCSDKAYYCCEEHKLAAQKR